MHKNFISIVLLAMFANIFSGHSFAGKRNHQEPIIVELESHESRKILETLMIKGDEHTASLTKEMLNPFHGENDELPKQIQDSLWFLYYVAVRVNHENKAKKARTSKNITRKITIAEEDFKKHLLPKVLKSQYDPLYYTLNNYMLSKAWTGECFS